MNALLSDYVVGAAFATDLVNTAPRVRSSGEALTDPATYAHFLEQHGLRPAALTGRAPTDDDLVEVRALRDDVRAVLECTTEDDAVAAATALVTRASTGPTLARDDNRRWQWYVPAATAAGLAGELAVVAGVGLLGVVHTLSHDRFRACAAPDCDGMFVDVSRAGRRRFCTPELCGNRVNVAQHRARRRRNSHSADRTVHRGGGGVQAPT